MLCVPLLDMDLGNICWPPVGWPAQDSCKAKQALAGGSKEDAPMALCLPRGLLFASLLYLLNLTTTHNDYLDRDTFWQSFPVFLARVSTALIVAFLLLVGERDTH